MIITILSLIEKMSKLLYKKISDLVKTVKQELTEQGIVVPTKLPNGEISFNNFRVVKDSTNFLVINSDTSEVCYKTSLPQTAILIANSLALNSPVDREIIQLDLKFINNHFEEKQLNRVAESLAKQKNWDRYDIVMLKYSIAKEKATDAKRRVIAQFNKLCYNR